MSSAPELSGDDRLAAEFALRLLEGEELLQARGRQRSDPAFARLIGEWEDRLAPMLDAVPAEAAPADLWSRISARLAENGGGEAATIHLLQRKAKLWRAYSAAVTAVAAVLLLVVGLDITRRDPILQQPAAPAEAATLVASLGAEGGPAALIITYDAEARSLIATPAVLQGAAGHSHELWVVPETGQPRSLGIVTAGKPRRLVIPPALLEAIGADATLAISVEPEGGSPTGVPTGPVIASGQLTRI
jgi:anti-sigma-K factor RskA